MQEFTYLVWCRPYKDLSPFPCKAFSVCCFEISHASCFPLVGGWEAAQVLTRRRPSVGDLKTAARWGFKCQPEQQTMPQQMGECWQRCSCYWRGFHQCIKSVMFFQTCSLGLFFVSCFPAVPENSLMLLLKDNKYYPHTLKRRNKLCLHCCSSQTKLDAAAAFLNTLAPHVCEYEYICI